MLSGSGRRPAAVASGVINEDDKVRWGFHNLRPSLASLLVQAGRDPKAVQALPRHADVKTALQIYPYSRNEDHMSAQGDMLIAFFAVASAFFQCKSVFKT